MAKVLERKNSRTMALASLNPDYPVREFKPSEIAWIARILWASQ
jgi:phage repressor protein C with HTH and peptisase S24 domain